MGGSSQGQRITRYRKKAGLSQKELAAAVGILPPVLSRYENDMREPPASVLVKIAAVLNITTDKLLGLDRPSPTSYQNKDEYILLTALRDLNDLGKERVIEYVSDLSMVPKYTD